MSEDTVVFTVKEIRAMLEHLKRAQHDPAEIAETIRFLEAKQVARGNPVWGTVRS